MTQPAQTPSVARLSDELRALRRSREDRVCAGVLGGLGRRLGVDPVLLRVVTVVLVFFGGSGLVLYALGWLLVPADGEQHSLLDKALGRGGAPRAGTSSVLLALCLAVVAVTTGIGVLGGFEGTALLVLAVAGVVLLLRREDGSGAPTDADPDPGGYPDAWPDGQDHDAAVRAWAAAGRGAEPVDETPAPASTRPRSVLGLVTSFLALLAVGSLAGVAAATGLAVPVSGYVALALGIVGAGLLVGTVVGRSRGLLAVGIVLTLALVPAAAADHFRLAWTAGDVFQRPTSAAQVMGTHEYGVGSVRWDLSGVDFADQERTLAIDQGAGELRVVVPPEVDVTVDASVGAGDLTLFDTARGGFGSTLKVTDHGADGPGGGRLTLRLELGVGELEVRRAPA